MAIVHQVVREGEAGGAKTDDEHLLAGVFTGERAVEIEGVPAGEQRVDFEAEGQFEDVFQGARFDLRDIDGFLLLEDAGLHAVIADAVAGGGCHGVVDSDDPEGPDGHTVFLDNVHFGDFFFEGAASETDAEDGVLEAAVLLFEAVGAGVFALVVALDAVVGLVEGVGEFHALIGEGETFAVTPLVGGEFDLVQAVAFDSLRRHQVEHVELVGGAEKNTGVVFRLACGSEHGPDGVLLGDGQVFGVVGFVGQPAIHMVSEGCFCDGAAEEAFQLLDHSGTVDEGSFFGVLAG